MSGCRARSYDCRLSLDCDARLVHEKEIYGWVNKHWVMSESYVGVAYRIKDQFADGDQVQICVGNYISLMVSK